MALLPAAGIAALGAATAMSVETLALHLFGGAVAVVGVIAMTGLAIQWVRPRIGFRGDQVVFNLRAGAGVAVPVEVVEAFFLGQGPAHIPQLTGNSAETVNLIARLSQKAPQWAKVEVKPALGHWCEGYVTIRGAWCEPLDNEVIRRLNRRLREAHEAQRDRSATAVAASSAEASA